MDIYWTESRLYLLSKELPELDSNVTRQSIVKWRYHFNTCTFSYTTVWWKWKEWEHLLDWLALRGVNLPLAWVANEYFLISLFREVGFTDQEIASFLSGPAFQTWNRFGNIQGSWGGDLPFKWTDDQLELQKKIVQRMVELGMTPVLPAFTGFLPRAATRLFPNATIVNGSNWNNFGLQYSNTTFLEPTDPLYKQLQKRFIELQKEVYGDISHIYALDQFNENTPLRGDLEYLKSVSSETVASLKQADAEAIWLLQGWLFFDLQSFWTTDRVEAYLSGSAQENDILVLDLYSEGAEQWQRTDSYFQKPWIWCLLHDYGGNQGLEGNLNNITTRPLAALAANTTMLGMGLTMEGQEGNEIVYDLFLDQAWRNQPIDVPSYVNAWVTRRYGKESISTSILSAWSLLRDSVYNNSYILQGSVVKSVFELRPNTTGLTDRVGHHGTGLFYDPQAVVNSSWLLLNATEANPRLLDMGTFHNDLTDITRQVLANAFISHYESLIQTWNSSQNSSEIGAAGFRLLNLLQDLDELLLCDKNFALSSWISSAVSWADGNDTYAQFLEYNAKSQLSLWGPGVNPSINDYASKQWSGLVSSYYYPRWSIFVEYLQSTPQGKGYQDSELSKRLEQFELGWQVKRWGQQQNESFALQKGDLWTVAQRVMAKWAP